jgi:hypothetical protein
MSNEKLYQDMLEQLERHEKNNGERFNQLFQAQKTNTDAIGNLTEAVSSLVQDTSSIIQLHKDFQGAARVGKGLQGFMVWLLKWGVIGAGVVALMNWVIEYFS